MTTIKQAEDYKIETIFIGLMTFIISLGLYDLTDWYYVFLIIPISLLIVLIRHI